MSVPLPLDVGPPGYQRKCPRVWDAPGGQPQEIRKQADRGVVRVRREVQSEGCPESRSKCAVLVRSWMKVYAIDVIATMHTSAAARLSASVAPLAQAALRLGDRTRLLCPPENPVFSSPIRLTIRVTELISVVRPRSDPPDRGRSSEIGSPAKLGAGSGGHRPNPVNSGALWPWTTPQSSTVLQRQSSPSLLRKCSPESEPGAPHFGAKSLAYLGPPLGDPPSTSSGRPVKPTPTSLPAESCTRSLSGDWGASRSE